MMLSVFLLILLSFNRNCTISSLPALHKHGISWRANWGDWVQVWNEWAWSLSRCFKWPLGCREHPAQPLTRFQASPWPVKRVRNRDESAEFICLKSHVSGALQINLSERTGVDRGFTTDVSGYHCTFRGKNSCKSGNHNWGPLASIALPVWL